VEPVAVPLPAVGVPYEDLRAENGRRGKHDPEYELLDTGVFGHDRYWITEVWYAKADPTDVLMTVRVTNAGPDADTVHVLPTAWFRNTWSWDTGATKPVLAGAGGSAITAEHPSSDHSSCSLAQARTAPARSRCFARTRPTSAACSARLRPRRTPRTGSAIM